MLLSIIRFQFALCSLYTKLLPELPINTEDMSSALSAAAELMAS